MKRKYLLFLWCWITALFLTGSVNAQVVISQVYGGGGNNGATIKNDYIELFNAGNTTVNVTGWSVQYASAAGTSWSKTALSGTIEPGRYYLIQQAAGTGGTDNLPTPNATGSINMSGTSGKVALVNNNILLPSGTSGISCPIPSASIVDFVGFGTTANCFEGAGATPAPSNTNAVIRAANGCTDTNNNNADFSTSAPAPRNSSSTANPCSTGATISIANVTVSEGNTGTTAATFTVTLSKPASDPITFDIATADGSATAGIDYTATVSTAQTIPAGNTSYTFTVPVIGDVQSEDNETFTVNVTKISGATPTSVTATGTITNDDGTPVTPIYTIQGSGATTTYSGTVTTTGVVVGDYQGASGLNGFFIQDAMGDNNTATSDGIFVFAPNSIDVTVGQVVQVSGTVAEFSGQTQISSVTNITPQGRATITPTVVNLPVVSTNTFEQYEGMLVTIPEKLTVTQNFTLGRFGEVVLSADLDYPFNEADGRLYNPTNFIDPTDTPASGVENDEDNKAAVTAQQNLHNRSSILLDDASGAQNPATIPYLGPDNTLRTGSTVNNLTGVLSFGFNFYRIQLTQTPDFAYAPRPLAPPSVGNANVKIASFNVLNYFNGNGNGGGFPTSRGANNLAEFNRQRAKIIAAIKGLDADVIGLIEMENDGDGETSAIADLVRGLNEATSAGTYDYIRDPGNGGTGTDEIKVAFIYKPGAVMPVGTALADLDAVHNRPPLAQTFKLNASGEIVTAVINHFKSKGGNGATGANADQGDGQGAFNADRVEQAEALITFINNTVVPAAKDNDVILLGDFNAYNEEDPIDVLREAGFINLFGPESYSYVFDGQSGSLDHALVSPSIYQQFTSGGKWHINADEPIFLDYNTEFKTASQVSGLYEPNAFRSSDHDPVLTGFNLTTPSISFANATATIDEGAGTYQVNLSLSEATREETTITFAITNNGDVMAAGYNTDYTTTPDGSTNTFTVTIPAGSTAASFAVNVTDDQLDELNETISLAITQVSNGLKLGTQTTLDLTIADNDTPTISFTQPGATISAGEGAFTITLKSSIAPVTDQTVTVAINDYAFEYGSKKGYVTSPNGATGTFTLTIPAGQTMASFAITTDKNMVKKNDSPQQIDFTISQVSAGATIGAPQTFVLAITGKKGMVASRVATYPNPATNQATIEVENAGVGEVTITLYNQVGNVVLSDKIKSRTTNLNTAVDVSRFTRGDYILIITTPNGTVRNHLLLK